MELGEHHSFREAAEAWLDVARHEASTRYTTRSYLRRHVLPAVGALDLPELTPAVLDRLYRSLELSLAPGTVRRIHGIVRAVCEQACVWGWLESNPAQRASAPASPRGDPHPPTPAVVASLIAAAPPLFACFLRLAATTGARRGELCALRWDDLNLDAGTMRKGRAIGSAGGRPYEKPTKTGAQQTIALDARTTEMLRAGLPGHSGFVFSEDGGRTPWRPELATRRFAQLRARLGVEVRLKDFRHFMATQLLASGVGIRTVAGRLAHSTSSTTLEFYAGWLAPDDRDAAEAMSRLLEGGHE